MEATPLVFDTGPLCHSATAGWLGALKAVVGTRRAIIPETVVAELQQGARADPLLRQVLHAGWIEHHALTTQAEIRDYARYRRLLAFGSRNLG